MSRERWYHMPVWFGINVAIAAIVAGLMLLVLWLAGAI